MKASDVISYFKTIAETHVDILHTPENKRFGRWNMIDTHGVSDLDLKGGFCLVLHQYEGDWAGPNVDRLMNFKEISFRVVKFADADDIDAQVEVQEQAEDICRDIVSKMLNDQEEGTELFADRQIDDIKWPVKFYPTRPNIDGEYGTAVEIRIGTHEDLTYNPAKWQ
jgi:hypothetical protein